jgi:ubiquinone biosynthesis protein UbiJ
LVWCEVKALKRTVADLERRLRRLETLFKVAELMTE